MSTPSGFRAVLVLGLLLIAAGCGPRAPSRSPTVPASGQAAPTVPASGQATHQLTGTVPLALQSSAPVWGGDSQPATTDIVRAAITPQQAADIAHVCSNAPAELPSSGASPCKQSFLYILGLPDGDPMASPPPPAAPCEITSLCLEVERASQGQGAQPDGFVQIVDMRPGTPLCSSGPRGLCFRLGAQNQVLQMLASAAPSGPPSSTLTQGPTNTSTSTDTGSPTSTVTTPTSPNPTTPAAYPTSGSSP